MKKSLQLRQSAATVLTEWRDALTALDAEQDATKKGELRTKAADLQKRHADLQDQIANAEALEAAEARAAEQSQNTRQPRTPRPSEEERASRQFSLIRAIANSAAGRQQDGIEAEMYQEADIEAQRSGVSLSGTVRMPAFLAMGVQQRDMTASVATEGGNTIATDLDPNLIGILRPRLTLEGLGARFLRGLVGNLDMPKQTGKTVAVWEGENTSADETNATIGKLSMTPKRLAAYVDVSNRLLVQSSIDVENMIRADLSNAVREGLETALINGTGSATVPNGILNAVGIGNVAAGTNGAAPTWAMLVSLWKEVAADNADYNTLAYLTTPGIAAQLMQTEKAASTAQFIWMTNNREGQVNGYRAATSTLVPSTLTKGTSTDCHAILYGDFSQLVVGQWAGVDIVVNPYTKAKDNLVEVIVNSYWDAIIRNVEGFAAIKDARVTI